MRFSQSERVQAGTKSQSGVEGPAVVATRWRVLELTLTPIPADPSVGVGRTRPANAAAQNERTAKMAKKQAANGATIKRGAVSIHIGSGDVAQDVSASDYTDEKEGRDVDADATVEEEEEEDAGREVISDEDQRDADATGETGYALRRRPVRRAARRCRPASRRASAPATPHAGAQPHHGIRKGVEGRRPG
jgi:hypothetical protein